MPNLEGVLNKLSAEKIAEVSMRFEMAREKYMVQSLTVDSFEGFKTEVTRFWQNLHQDTVSRTVCWPDEDAFGFAWTKLDAAYPGGLRPAYRDCRAGLNGGLAGVLDAITESMKREAEERYIFHAIRDALDLNELDFTAMQEFLNSLLRELGVPELTVVDAAVAVPQWNEHIWRYVRALQAVRGPAGSEVSDGQPG